MSKSLNKIMIIGNLGADPEVRTTGGGTKVANLRVATNERWNDRDGNPQEHTEWHRVVFYGPVAEVAEKYATKGSRIYVEGSIRTEKWQDRDGNDRYTTEVRGRNLILLDSRGDGGYSDGGGGGGGRRDDSQDYSGDAHLSDDDIPF